jgi:hypothetical protein
VSRPLFYRPFHEHLPFEKLTLIQSFYRTFTVRFVGHGYKSKAPLGGAVHVDTDDFTEWLKHSADIACHYGGGEIADKDSGFILYEWPALPLCTSKAAAMQSSIDLQNFDDDLLALLSNAEVKQAK